MTAGEDNRSAEQIERDLASTREDLEGTLEALNTKLDVKTRATAWAKENAEIAQAQAKILAERAQVQGKVLAERAQAQAKVLIDERGPELRIAGGAAALAVVALLFRRGRR